MRRQLVLRPHPGFSVVVDRPAAVTGLVVGAAALVATVLGLALGDYPIGLRTVVRALVGGAQDGPSFVVTELRLPRVLAGLFVGAALGIAGALTQAVARNPLASPDVLGVTAGASAAAVACIVLGAPGWLSVSGAALAGGFGTAATVVLLSGRNGLGGSRLVLLGVGLAAMLSALTSWMLVRGRVTDLTQATVWLTGSLNARTWSDVVPVTAGLGLLLPVVIGLARHVRLLELDPDTAAALGERTSAVRLLAVAVAVGLAALATATAGPVAFVALVAPQAVRRIAGTPHIPLLLSGLAGAALVTGADVLAHQGPFGDQPVGVVTAIAGAPALLWLLARSRRLGGTS